MIGIVQTGTANLQSIVSVLMKYSRKYKICESEKDFKNISKIILPGIGSFKSFSKNIKKNNMNKAIHENVKSGIPILGICLGFHALFESSYEFGEHKGFGFLKGQVIDIKKINKNSIVPHVGWNECNLKKKSKFFINIGDKKNFYFTHSFSPINVNKSDILATTKNHSELICAIESKNIIGVQFHPEKSQLYGLRLFENFFKI